MSERRHQSLSGPLRETDVLSCQNLWGEEKGKDRTDSDDDQSIGKKEKKKS